MKRFKLTISLDEIIDETMISVIENNITVPYPFDHDKRIPLNLSTAQKNIINKIEENNKVIIKQDRQTGVSTVMNSIIAYKMTSGDVPIEILLIGANGNTNDADYWSIKENIDVLIDKSKHNGNYVKMSKREILLTNGSSLKFINGAMSGEHSIKFTEPHDGRKIEQWVIFNQLSTHINMCDLYFDFTRRYMNPNVKVIIASHTSLVDELFFPIWFLGNRIGFTKVEANLIDSHISKLQLEHIGVERVYEMLSKFTIADPSKFNAKKMLDSINRHLPKSEFVSIVDLLHLLHLLSNNRLNNIIN